MSSEEDVCDEAHQNSVPLTDTKAVRTYIWRCRDALIVSSISEEVEDSRGLEAPEREGRQVRMCYRQWWCTADNRQLVDGLEENESDEIEEHHSKHATRWAARLQS
eukprot:scaffold134123_cov32-Tisochrysis_lutea.AAC.1